MPRIRKPVVKTATEDELISPREIKVRLNLSHTLATDIEFELEKLNAPKFSTFGRLLQHVKDALN